MKQLTKNFAIIIMVMLFTGYSAMAQKTATNNSNTKNTTTMKTYLIEREIPDAGKLTPEQLKGISQKSCIMVHIQ